MQKTVKLLTALLGFQLLLALVIIGLSDRGVSAPPEATPLITAAREEIDHITLEGPDKLKVVLARTESGWRLPGAGNFPADADRIDQMIDRLIGLRAGSPVATTRGARERFKVSEDAFERRITLAQGDKTLSRLYLGTTPSVHRIHARAAGRDDIHAIELAVNDVPVKAANWEDKSILTLPKASISAIETSGLRLEPKPATADALEPDGTSNPSGSAWQAKGLEEGRNLNPNAADKLAGRLADLSFDYVLGWEAKPEYGLAQPTLEIRISLKDGDTLTYRIGKAEREEGYTLKVSNRPEYFSLASFMAQPLIEAASLEHLLTVDKETHEEDESKQSEKS